MEEELIKYYGRIDINTGILCNLTSGGTGCKEFTHDTGKHSKQSIKDIIVEYEPDLINTVTKVKQLTINLPAWWHNRHANTL